MYKTSPQRHGFLMTRLAAFQAIGGAYIEPQLFVKMNRLNVQHRTLSNDDATLYRF
jgi:hypothetical protein